jgi:fumarylacetoacetate (FAA) hydrolase family protein
MSTGVATAAGTGLQGAVQGYHKQREMARQDKAQEAQEKLQLSQAGKLDAEAETEAKRKKLIEAQAEIESNNAALSTRMQELTGQLMEAQAQNKRDEAIEIGKRIKELAASMVTSQITEKPAQGENQRGKAKKRQGGGRVEDSGPQVSGEERGVAR